MANAGRILIIPRGQYNANEVYEMLDLVNYNGTSWLAKKHSCGIFPSTESSEYWFDFIGINTNAISVANNLTTTEEGLALDARQGKVLIDALNATNEEVTGVASQLADTKTQVEEIGESLSATAETVASINSAVEGINSAVSTLQSNATIIIGTLAVGATSIVLEDERITTDSMLSFYTSVWGANPTSVAVESGKITLSFDAKTVEVKVGVRIDG